MGQYAVLEAREWAERGFAVTLVGLTSGPRSRELPVRAGSGSVEIIRVHRPKYQKQKFVERLIWTVASNVALLRSAFAAMRAADVVLFTGSPPLMLHFIAPLNVALKKRLIYRIMDFHPECLIAERGKCGFLLHSLLSLTHFWRRRISSFEVLGQDQAVRLHAIGIPDGRIEIKPNPSPVAFPPGLVPLPLPKELEGGSGVILYSGNWGVAHDEDTFIEAYARYVSSSGNPLRLWINATGAKADRVERELLARGVPFCRSHLVPLEQLAGLLTTVDVHLITLRDAFVGYVLPSKIHACIESGKRILFIGSPSSDVHRLAQTSVANTKYRRVDVGDVEAALAALKCLETDILMERQRDFRERQAREGRSSRPLPVTARTIG